MANERRAAGGTAGNSSSNASGSGSCSSTGDSRREAERVLRHLVCEGVLREDVSKSEMYGSVSAVLRVSRAGV